MARRKGENRIIINLACSQCREKNYTTTKNSRNDPQKLERRKYCSRCQIHTLHKEGK